MLDKLRHEITVELEMLAELMDVAKPVVRKALAEDRPADVEIYALGGIIQSLYGGLENAFKRIAKAFQIIGLEGAEWHKQLLVQMGPSQLRVLSEDLVSRLQDYLKFCHLFRHAYLQRLKWEKLANLVSDLEAVADESIKQLRAYRDRLP